MDYKVLNKKRNTFYEIVFFIGLLLIIWEISIYRKTVVSLSYLLLIIGSVGSLATFLDFNNYRKTYDLKAWKLYAFAFLQNTVSWGFIVCSLLVLSNYYFAQSDLQQERHEIIETSSMVGSSRDKQKPLVRIDYHGKVKELVFSSKYYPDLEDYKYVTIATKKGYLNWDIIVSQSLEK